MDLKTFFTFTFILAGAFAQISNDLDVDDIKKKAGELLPDLDMSKIDESKLPQFDEFEAIFRTKCDNKSGDGTYDMVKPASDTYQECISSFVNFTQLSEEVEEAKKTGSMDEVFGRYCDKYPELNQCTNDFLEAIDPCLEDNEQKSLNISLGLSHKLKDFVCHKNGDRIAMFVAEGGIECIRSQKEALQQCVNSTLGSRIPMPANAEEAMAIQLPVLMFDVEDCKDFSKFRTCVSEALAKCKETTPSNLVDALFKYLKKILPCSIEAAETKASESKDNNGGYSIASTTSLSLVLAAIVLVKLC